MYRISYYMLAGCILFGCGSAPKKSGETAQSVYARGQDAPAATTVPTDTPSILQESSARPEKNDIAERKHASMTVANSGKLLLDRWLQGTGQSAIYDFEASLPEGEKIYQLTSEKVMYLPITHHTVTVYTLHIKSNADSAQLDVHRVNRNVKEGAVQHCSAELDNEETSLFEKEVNESGYWEAPQYK